MLSANEDLLRKLTCMKAWYNFFAHPLRSVPGPIPAKLFPQYMSLSMIKGRRAFVSPDLK